MSLGLVSALSDCKAYLDIGEPNVGSPFCACSIHDNRRLRNAEQHSL